MHTSLYKSLFALICALHCLLFVPVTYADDESVPKLVYLIEDDDTLIASNIKFNRFDEVKLKAKEKVVNYAEGNAVIIVATNQRIIGYSVYTASWKTRGLIVDESVKSISAEDYSALVQTSKRFLSFNGKNGVWSEMALSKIFR